MTTTPPASSVKLPKAAGSFWVIMACVAVVVIIVIFLIFRIRILGEKLASLCRDNAQRMTADDVVAIVHQYGYRPPPAAPSAMMCPAPARERAAAAVEDERDVPADEIEELDVPEDTADDSNNRAVVLDDDGNETGEVLSNLAEKKDQPDSDPEPAEAAAPAASDFSDVDLSDMPDNLEGDPAPDQDSEHPPRQLSEFAKQMMEKAQADPQPSLSVSPSPPPSPPKRKTKPKAKASAKKRKQ